MCAPYFDPFEAFFVTLDVSLVAIPAQCGKELSGNWPQATEKTQRVRSAVDRTGLLQR